MKNLPNVLHEKEYTGISNLDLIAIIEKRSPKLSDEIKKVFMFKIIFLMKKYLKQYKKKLFH